MDFEDRLLTHLQVVIGVKLRRGESFYFSWKDDQQLGNGRTSIWMHPHASLVFKFYGSRVASINPAWIHALEITANTNSGLRLVAEPDDPRTRTDSS